MPELLLLAGASGLVLSAALLVATLRLASPVSFVLGVFVVAWSLLVAETMLLSLVRSWTRGWMLAAIGIGLGAAFWLWRRAISPRPPAFGPSLRRAGAALGDPVVALVGVANLLAGAYIVVVALAIPPLDVDALGYHLPRIVLWMQQHAVASIPSAPSSNLDANPPGAEIAQGLTMLLSQGDRYAALFQVACLPVGALAVAGIARRIGLDVGAALLGGLLYAAFPIVALQAPTALNDLAVATALVLACFFALGGSRGELALCATAVALALSTKISGILALPSVALLALVALPPGRRLGAAVAVAAGCLLGSWWYVYNLVRTGAWDGHLGSDYGQVPTRAPDEILLRLERYLLQTLDLAGVVGRDRYVFPVVATALGVGAAAVWRSGRRRVAGLVAAGALVALAPWLVDWAHVAAVRAVARSWIAVGRPGVIGEFPMHAEARPFPGETWFGPTFAIGLLAAGVLVWRTVTGRRRLVLFTALLLAPSLLYLVNSAAFVYDGARGRFFVLAGGLAATALGIVLRVRPLAWATATIAVVTLGLSLVHYHGRPAGVRLFEPLSEPTLWGEPRWRAQTALAPSPESVRSARLIEALPKRAVLAVAAERFAVLYPLMGAGPWRTVRFLGPGDSIPGDATFLAVQDGTRRAQPAGWRRIPGITTWRVYERPNGT